VVVSGEPVYEKILEWGDRVKAGDIELEFRKQLEVAKVEEKPGKREALLRAAILAIAVLTAGLMGVNAVIEKRHQKIVAEKAKQLAVAPQMIHKQVHHEPASLARLSVEERLKIARLQYEIANRFHAEAKISDENLYLSIVAWNDIIQDLKDVQPEPEISKLSRDRIEKAEAELRDRLTYLKNNAFVAHEAGLKSDLPVILRQMMATIPDPENKEFYQWAQLKLLNPNNP
jgi:hypothetical protein